MNYYSISIQVPLGHGDYESDFLTVVNAEKMTRATAIERAELIISEHKSRRALVFVGKDLGKLVYDTAEVSQ